MRSARTRACTFWRAIVLEVLAGLQHLLDRAELALERIVDRNDRERRVEVLRRLLGRLRASRSTSSATA